MSAAASVAAGRPLPVASFAEWRAAARDLLAHGVAPELVTWSEPGAADPGLFADLFSGAPEAAASSASTR